MASEKEGTTAPRKRAGGATAKKSTPVDGPTSGQPVAQTGGRTAQDAQAGVSHGAGALDGGAAADTRQGGGPTKRGGAAKTATAGGSQSGGAAGGGTAKKAGAKGAGRGSGGGMQDALRDFVASHSRGWGHDQWIGLVQQLEQRGHDVSDRDSIGMQLENERMRLQLGRLDGLKPKQLKTVIDRYGTMWNLRNASADEIAAATGIDRGLAERVAGLAR